MRLLIPVLIHILLGNDRSHIQQLIRMRCLIQFGLKPKHILYKGRMLFAAGYHPFPGTRLILVHGALNTLKVASCI